MWNMGRWCTHQLYLPILAVVGLHLLKVQSLRKGNTITDEEPFDFLSMTKEAIMAKMVIPEDSPLVKETKSVIAQYLLSLAIQDVNKMASTTESPSTTEAPTTTLPTTPKIRRTRSTTTESPTTLPTTPKMRRTRSTTTESPTTTTTTEIPEPEYLEEDVTMEKQPSKQEATNSIEDVIFAAIFQAQAEESTTTMRARTTTTTTPKPRRTRSTTQKTTTENLDYPDDYEDISTTLRPKRMRTNRPVPTTINIHDYDNYDENGNEITSPMPGQVQTGNVIITDIGKLLSNVGTANVSGIVETSLKIASVDTVQNLVGDFFNLFVCTPLDQLLGRCKQQPTG